MGNKSDYTSNGWTDTLVASAARTASGNSGLIAGYGPAKSLRVQLDVTAVSGTSPSATVLVEDTLDGTTYNTIGTFAAKTAAGREVINITGLFSDNIRVTWTITGTTPSFTFSVVATARTQ